MWPERSSGPSLSAMEKIFLTKRLYIDQFLLLKNCNYLDNRNYWKVLFQTLNVHHQQILFFKFLFFLFSFLLPPPLRSFTSYVYRFIYPKILLSRLFHVLAYPTILYTGIIMCFDQITCLFINMYEFSAVHIDYVKAPSPKE